MTAWIAVLGAAAVTYAIRASGVLALHGRVLSPTAAHQLRLVAPAVLAGLIASSLFATGGALGLPPAGHLVAVAAGGAVATRTRQPAHALLVGLPVAWIAAALGMGS